MTSTNNGIHILLFLLTFGMFTTTIHPTIAVGDSSEIVASAVSLGIPHPPGYPLFISIAKLLALALPFGNAAYKVNILAALLGASTCMLLCLVVAQLTSTTSLMTNISAFFLACSYQFWYRSTVAEVYTLNTFLFLLLIFVLIIWKKHVSDFRYLYLISFLLGLAVGNHHTIVLMIPGATILIWCNLRLNLHQEDSTVLACFMSRASYLTFFFLLGLSIYLYLPLRSANDPIIDWGDPQSLNNFIDVFTRKVYLPEGVERTSDLLLKQISSFSPINEFGIAGFLLGMIGIWWLWTHDKTASALLFLTFLLTSYGLILLAGPSGKNMDLLKKFYLPSYTVFSIFIGVGIFKINTLLSAKSRLPQLIFFAVLAFSLIFQFANNLPRANNSNNYLAYDYGMNELDSIRNNAIYLSKGEVKTFPLWYLQGVERYREDVKVITAYFFSQRWYLKEAVKLVGSSLHTDSGTYEQMMVNGIYRENAAKGVYIGFLDEKFIPKDLLTYTHGITFQLHRIPGEITPGDVWPLYKSRGIRRIEKNMNTGTEEILKDYASSHYNTGIEFHTKGDLNRAMEEFEKSVAIDPDDPDSLNNLAVTYIEKGVKLKDAERLAMKAIDLYSDESDKKSARETLSEARKKMGSRL